MFWIYVVMLLFARRRTQRRPIPIRFCAAGRTYHYTLNGGTHGEDRS